MLGKLFEKIKKPLEDMSVDIGEINKIREIVSEGEKMYNELPEDIKKLVDEYAELAKKAQGLMQEIMMKLSSKGYDMESIMKIIMFANHKNIIK